MNDLTEDKFRQLKEEVEEANEAAAQAEGALAELLKRLKAEFDCRNLAEAKDLLAKIQRRRDEAHAAFDKQLATYQKNWKR